MLFFESSFDPLFSLLLLAIEWTRQNTTTVTQPGFEGLPDSKKQLNAEWSFLQFDRETQPILKKKKKNPLKFHRQANQASGVSPSVGCYGTRCQLKSTKLQE